MKTHLQKVHAEINNYTGSTNRKAQGLIAWANCVKKAYKLYYPRGKAVERVFKQQRKIYFQNMMKQVKT